MNAADMSKMLCKHYRQARAFLKKLLPWHHTKSGSPPADCVTMQLLRAMCNLSRVTVRPSPKFHVDDQHCPLWQVCLSGHAAKHCGSGQNCKGSRFRELNLTPNADCELPATCKPTPGGHKPAQQHVLSHPALPDQAHFDSVCTVSLNACTPLSCTYKPSLLLPMCNSSVKSKRKIAQQCLAGCLDRQSSLLAICWYKQCDNATSSYGPLRSACNPPDPYSGCHLEGSLTFTGAILTGAQ